MAFRKIGILATLLSIGAGTLIGIDSTSNHVSNSIKNENKTQNLRVDPGSDTMNASDAFSVDSGTVSGTIDYSWDDSENVTIDSTNNVVFSDAAANVSFSKDGFDGFLITAIGDNFLNNVTIQSMAMFDSIITIGNGFMAYSNVKSVEFDTSNSSLETVGNNFLFENDLLWEIYLPNNLTNIGDNFLSNCDSLFSAHLENTRIVEMPDYSFQFDYSLEETYFPYSSSLATIGMHVLEGCSSVQWINFGDSVYLTSIGDFFANDCTSLTDVHMPDYLKEPLLLSIGDDFLSNCTSLITFTFPEYLESLGHGAFANDSELRDLYFYGETLPMNPGETDFLSGTKFANNEEHGIFLVVEEVTIGEWTTLLENEALNDGYTLQYLVPLPDEKAPLLEIITQPELGEIPSNDNENIKIAVNRANQGVNIDWTQLQIFEVSDTGATLTARKNSVFYSGSVDITFSTQERTPLWEIITDTTLGLISDTDFDTIAARVDELNPDANIDWTQVKIQTIDEYNGDIIANVDSSLYSNYVAFTYSVLTPVWEIITQTVLGTIPTSEITDIQIAVDEANPDSSIDWSQLEITVSSDTNATIEALEKSTIYSGSVEVTYIVQKKTDLTLLITQTDLGTIPTGEIVDIQIAVDEANSGSFLDWSQLTVYVSDDENATIEAKGESTLYSGSVNVTFQVQGKTNIAMLITQTDLGTIPTKSPTDIKIAVGEKNPNVYIEWTQLSIVNITSENARIEAKQDSALYFSFVDVSFALPPTPPIPPAPSDITFSVLKAVLIILVSLIGIGAAVTIVLFSKPSSRLKK